MNTSDANFISKSLVFFFFADAVTLHLVIAHHIAFKSSRPKPHDGRAFARNDWVQPQTIQFKTVPRSSGNKTAKSVDGRIWQPLRSSFIQISCSIPRDGRLAWLQLLCTRGQCRYRYSDYNRTQRCFWCHKFLPF